MQDFPIRGLQIFLVLQLAVYEVEHRVKNVSHVSMLSIVWYLINHLKTKYLFYIRT
jgi:hypothetical protein